MPDDPAERRLIAAYIAERGVTQLPPAYAARVQYALPEAEQDRRIAALRPRVFRVSKALWWGPHPPI